LFFPEFQESRREFSFAVGKKAIDLYLESGMKGRFMKSIKAVLPNRSFTKTKIASQFFTAEDLVAMIISALKKKADAFVGHPVDRAVIGRPVVFSENAEKDAMAQERLSRAVKMAGFREFYFQMEPIAAAYTYERSITADELVLVADFGGGTSDFTLMNLRPSDVALKDRSADMVAKGGIYIGGDNFDSQLMWHKGTPHFGRGLKERFAEKWLDLPSTYFTNITSWEKMNFLNSHKMIEAIKRSYVFTGRDPKMKSLLALLENNLGYSLFQEIEQTKIALTDVDEASLSFQAEEIDLQETVGIKEYGDSIINEEVTKIENYLNKFLEDNAIGANEIDTVFMTGGTSMVRPLKDKFLEKFGSEKVKSGDNFNSVSMGLALSFPD